MVIGDIFMYVVGFIFIIFGIGLSAVMLFAIGSEVYYTFKDIQEIRKNGKL